MLRNCRQLVRHVMVGDSDSPLRPPAICGMVDVSRAGEGQPSRNRGQLQPSPAQGCGIEVAGTV